MQLDKIKINFANFLAFCVVATCFVYFFYISSSRFPVAMIKEISDIKIAMITIVTGIISYYFGSSKSSKDKDEVIKDMNASK